MWKCENSLQSPNHHPPVSFINGNLVYLKNKCMSVEIVSNQTKPLFFSDMDCDSVIPAKKRPKVSCSFGFWSNNWPLNFRNHDGMNHHYLRCLSQDVHHHFDRKADRDLPHGIYTPPICLKAMNGTGLGDMDPKKAHLGIRG